MTTKSTKLPGLGKQYDITTRNGRHISVVAHQDGRRFLGFYDEDDPDACQGTVQLDREEAESLAEILAPGENPRLGTCEMEIDLVTARIPMSGQSPYSGEPLGATRARTRTGASIVAVLRRTGAVPSPGPDFRLEAGDTLVAVGTREGVDELTRIISGT
ncbi:cation:proton antiporter regulatory subunit [Streptomyces albus]|uniref:Potassium transporter TrkA n=1 Tax=Streptomyces albus TaxID=1888 RepID=A0A6C1C199_9ACTN|nr:MULTISPECIES: cation:proton antiporter regulatory subunit [Streptomyces]KPC93389.1 potassium transporter TrkA [Streptomyces sp. NRRL F-6602]MDI6411277.1 cation:proton antiporter regulatory subunit [Streptomyces albus]QID35262.1 cation:proton antiporter regulatory subunit [Streptomyces albus]TGG82165.1 potassium transporter TrkA [Streptomyces albus]UVN57952.1 cation:proton antiporter regulatory subunit [Streptomyces albus]